MYNSKLPIRGCWFHCKTILIAADALHINVELIWRQIPLVTSGIFGSVSEQCVDFKVGQKRLLIHLRSIEIMNKRRFWSNLGLFPTKTFTYLPKLHVATPAFLVQLFVSNFKNLKIQKYFRSLRFSDQKVFH